VRIYLRAYSTKRDVLRKDEKRMRGFREVLKEKSVLLVHHFLGLHDCA